MADFYCSQLSSTVSEVGWSSGLACQAVLTARLHVLQVNIQRTDRHPNLDDG